MILSVITAILAVITVGWAVFLQVRRRQIAEHFEGELPSIRPWWILAGVAVLFALNSAGLWLVPELITWLGSGEPVLVLVSGAVGWAFVGFALLVSIPSYWYRAAQRRSEGISVLAKAALRSLLSLMWAGAVLALLLR